MSLPSANQVRHLFVINGNFTDANNITEGDVMITQHLIDGKDYATVTTVQEREFLSSEPIFKSQYKPSVYSTDSLNTKLNTYKLNNNALKDFASIQVANITIEAQVTTPQGIITKSGIGKSLDAAIEDFLYADKDDLVYVDIANKQFGDTANYWERGTFFTSVNTVKMSMYITDENGKKIGIPNAFVLDEDANRNASDGVKKLADLEVYCAAERGSNYNGMGYPYVRMPKYRVDTTKKYYLVNFHFAEIGSNEAVQKSERDITFACLNESTANAIANLNSYSA